MSFVKNMEKPKNNIYREKVFTKNSYIIDTICNRFVPAFFGRYVYNKNRIVNGGVEVEVEKNNLPASCAGYPAFLFFFFGYTFCSGCL